MLVDGLETFGVPNVLYLYEFQNDSCEKLRKPLFRESENSHLFSILVHQHPTQTRSPQDALDPVDRTRRKMGSLRRLRTR